MAKPGTFKPGQSGNPGGRPKALMEVIELARKETAASIKTLAKIRDDETAPHAARVTSADVLLKRGWGNPVQPIDGDGQGGAIRVTWEDEK